MWPSLTSWMTTPKIIWNRTSRPMLRVDHIVNQRIPTTPCELRRTFHAKDMRHQTEQYHSRHLSYDMIPSWRQPEDINMTVSKDEATIPDRHATFPLTTCVGEEAMLKKCRISFKNTRLQPRQFWDESRRGSRKHQHSKRNSHGKSFKTKTERKPGQGSSNIHLAGKHNYWTGNAIRPTRAVEPTVEKRALK